MRMRYLSAAAIAAVALVVVMSGAAEAGKFCVKRGIFPEPNTWVRLGSCPQKGKCVTLRRLSLYPEGGYVCGVMQTDMNRRFSFPAHGRRYFGTKGADGTVYFN